MDSFEYLMKGELVGSENPDTTVNEDHMDGEPGGFLTKLVILQGYPGSYLLFI